MGYNSTKQRYTQLLEWLDTRSIKRINKVKAAAPRVQGRESTRPSRKSF